MGFLESIFYMAWRGIAIGLIISAPMGPVGMLCIQRTLDKGRRAGLYTGIGAAISDLFYSLLTGFGLSFIEEFLERNQNVIQLVGSGVLIAFGVYLIKKNPAKSLKKPIEQNISIKKNILGGFLFTFSNPLILFLIIGLFARFNFLLPEFQVYQYFTGFVFIFIGALIWWWFITYSIDKVRSHFNIRSMWLINRIIGCIVLLFAVVGIFTATTALVNGAEITCWNSKRGFGPFSQGEETSPSARLNNTGRDTLAFMAPCDRADAVEFRFKVRNHKTRYPWGIRVKDTDGRVTDIDIKSAEGDFDGIGTAPALEVGLRPEGHPYKAYRFTDKTDLSRKITKGTIGPDASGALNFYKLTLYGDNLSLLGGIHTPGILLSEILPYKSAIDSVGIFLIPGASLSLDEIRLSTSRFSPVGNNPWEDMELLKDYLANSNDSNEGLMQIMDRSLDESLLRLGGDYRLALVKATDGYDLLYLSGAKVNSDNWSFGMTKGHLSPSKISGIWNVMWIDAMHQPLSHELKGQFDKNGTLSIQFPYQNSTIRLHPAE